MKTRKCLRRIGFGVTGVLVLGLMGVSPAFAEQVPGQEMDQKIQAVYAQYDKDQSGALDADEFAKTFIGLFATLDDNHDDLLEAGELPNGWTAEVNEADVNQNQKLEFSEVINHISESFAVRDTDGNGLVSKDEAKAYMEKVQSEQQAV